MEGVVLQTYGQGNGPTSRADIMAALKEASKRGVLIVNITQCSRGIVSPAYAVGKDLQDIGVVAGSDMTVEAALMKLSYVIGKKEWSLYEKRQVTFSLPRLFIYFIVFYAFVLVQVHNNMQRKEKNNAMTSASTETDEQ